MKRSIISAFLLGISIMPLATAGDLTEADVQGFMDDAERYVMENRLGLAMSFASGSHQFEVGPNAPPQISLTGGHFARANALSLAAGGQVNNRTFISGNIAAAVADSVEHEEYGFGFNITWSLGQ